MDAMCLSLDEIIAIGKKAKPGKTSVKQKAKASKQPKPKPARTRGKKKPTASPNGRKKLAGVTKKPRPADVKPKVIVDARMKIIQKKRAQIRDARDKLVEIARNSGDARLRLLKRKGKLPPGNGILKKGPAGVKKFPEVISLEYEMDVDMHRPIGPLKRTVRNEMFTVPSTMPPLPTFSRNVRNSPPPQPKTSSWNTDPFDCYEVHSTRPAVQKALPPSRIPQYEEMPRRGMVPRSPPPPHPMYAENRPHLSSTMRARLERAPNPSESMGIFSKMPVEIDLTNRHHHHHRRSPSPPMVGYRIVVSNLHSSVTQNDIKELFEDIGDLLESRLVRPGVAEVIYRTLKDAEEAVDTYHNRQLDGQPMKCLLVKPRASNKPTAPAITYSSSSRPLKPSSMSSASVPKKPHVEIDIDALHTVLFRRDY